MNLDTNMYEHYCELTIEGVTKGRDLHHAYILILREKKGVRLLPILISNEEYKSLVAALHYKVYTCSRLMNKLAHRVGMTMLGVRLLVPHNGHTQALIDFELINEVVSITVSAADAAIAVLETKSSMWIERSRMEMQARVHPADNQMALSLYAMNKELLQEALQSAVEEENFELASVLRDELNKRNLPTPPTLSTENNS